MADILVRCPKTGQEVSTGLKTEWVMFETLPGIQMPLTCPACGETHNWRPKDAWISNHNGAVETVTPEKAWHEIERLRSDIIIAISRACSPPRGSSLRKN